MDRPLAEDAAGVTRSSDDFDVSLLRRFIVWLVALKIAGLILIFDPAGLDVFNLPKSLWSRSIDWFLLALLCVALLRFGRGIVPTTRLHFFVMVFVAANILSAIFAVNRYVALFGDRDQYLGLAFVLDMFVLYWAVAIAFRRMTDWVVLGVILSIASLAALGYGAAQRAGVDPVFWEDADATRPSSTFGNPDIFGHYLSSLFGAAIGLVVFARGRLSVVSRGVALCFAAVSVLAVGVVATRGSLLGFGAALIAGALIYVRLQGLRSRSTLRVGLIALGALALLAGILVTSPLGERAAAASGTGVRERLYIYASAVAAFGDRAILGYGPDSFGVAYPRNRMPGVTAVTGTGFSETSAHSWPLQMAATLGVLGLASFFAMLVAWAASLWTVGLARSPGMAACAAMATAGYLGHGLVSISAVSIDWIPWLGFGAAASLTGARQIVVRRELLRHAVAFAVLFSLAIIGTLVSLPALLANQDALLAKLRLRDGLSGEATLAALSSVKLDPGRADHWNWLGLGLEQQKLWQFAGDAFAEAVERAPHSAAYWSNLARARAWQAVGGDDESAGVALEAARQAAAADPNAPEPNTVLADIAYLFGQYDLSLDAATRAIHLYPMSESEELAALAALGLADPAEARRKLETLLAIRDSAPLHLAVAQLSLTLNDFEAARVHAERVLQLSPESVEARRLISKATR